LLQPLLLHTQWLPTPRYSYPTTTQPTDTPPPVDKQMDADALEGCVLKLDEGMARHPERAGVLGSLEITSSTAQGACVCAMGLVGGCMVVHGGVLEVRGIAYVCCRHAIEPGTPDPHQPICHPPTNTPPPELELVRGYTLRQEGGAARDPLFVAAPTERSGGDLEVLRPTRRVVVGEDVPAANRALVERTYADLPWLQFYPDCMAPERGAHMLQQEVRDYVVSGLMMHVPCMRVAWGLCSVYPHHTTNPTNQLTTQPNAPPQHRFPAPPTAPPAGSWPPAWWAPGPALQERDRRRAARRKRGLPEIDPQDDLEQQQLTDLRPAPGAPWGRAGGRVLPPQWRALPESGSGGVDALGDMEQDVSIAYRYG